VGNSKRLGQSTKVFENPLFEDGSNDTDEEVPKKSKRNPTITK